MTLFASPPASPSRSISGSSNRATSDNSSAASEPLPTRITRYRLTPEQVPVDFFADPDGQWDFASLVEMAGFNPEHPGASVGALTAPFDGYPEGSAVITEVGVECHYVALAALPKTACKDVVDHRQVRPTAAQRSSASQHSSQRRQPHRAA